MTANCAAGARIDVPMLSLVTSPQPIPAAALQKRVPEAHGRRGERDIWGLPTA
jgi:hypothetical protein